MRRTRKTRITPDVERLQTGFDHAEAGAALLGSWDFPDQIVDAVRWHHDPMQADNLRLARAIQVADKIVRFATRLRTSSRLLEIWV